MSSTNYLAENIYVKVYTEDYFDEKGLPIIGIKDLLDSNGDYHKIEFIKFEMISLFIFLEF